MPSLDPSGGQAPALHFPSPPLWIPAFAGMTIVGVGAIQSPKPLSVVLVPMATVLRWPQKMTTTVGGLGFSRVFSVGSGNSG